MRTAGVLLILVTLLAAVVAVPVVAGGPPDHGTTNPQTLSELAQARRATAQYHDVSSAEADGYVRLTNHIPGQGIHYLNPGIAADAVFEIQSPELLVYVEQGGKLKLAAVEYAAPTPASPDAPEGFTGDDDEWEIHHAACHYVDGSEIDDVPVPEDCPDPNPETGAAFASWHPDLWVLHAWVWRGNPHGVFAHTNPNVP